MADQLDKWTKVATASSAVVIGLSLAYAVIVRHAGAQIETPLGRFIIEQAPRAEGPSDIKDSSVKDSGVVTGGPREARPGTNQTVWQSTCPPNSRVLSGICRVLDEGNVPPLQNVGADLSSNRWECVWRGSVQKAFVQAFCLTLEGNTKQAPKISN